ncbi:hypothetical protein [Actinoallomurus sp. NPDC050550]|uniref:hypothetical protein n=1 Tax=Actinoallomurus sp. NPDC050550 TaxID=3154937 RepID=UPI0033F54BA6
MGIERGNEGLKKEGTDETKNSKDPKSPDNNQKSGKRDLYQGPQKHINPSGARFGGKLSDAPIGISHRYDLTRYRTANRPDDGD